MWTGATAAVLGVLVLVTALAVAVARELRRATGVPLSNASALDMPDWLADAVAIGGRTAARLGPLRPIAVESVRLMDRRLVPAIRRYPLGAAAILSVAFGIAATIPQAVEEGYVLSGQLLFISVAAGGMFAFLVTVGAYLRLAGTAQWPRRRLVHALVAACASLPITIAFRDALWSMLSVNGRHAGATGLEVLVLLIAITTGAIAFAAEPLLPRHPDSREI